MQIQTPVSVRNVSIQILVSEAKLEPTTEKELEESPLLQ